jgi:glycosyltransferase involved in cell wall biosynthesis
LYDGNLYVYLINHPNEEYIKHKHREKIAEILRPTDYLNNKVIYAMDCLKLNKGKFKVIHVRIEDEFSNNDYAILNSRINYILYTLKSVIFETYDDIFLISNNNQLKNILIQKNPKIKTIFNDITHIAYKDASEEKIINTLKDFYIMSNSNCIYSFSVYQHGSGFSKWCAVTYNIPYVCYYMS